MTRPSLFRPLALAALLAVSGASHAAMTVYTDEASFQSAIGSFGTDTFEDLEAGIALPAGPAVRSAGSLGYTVSVGPNSDILYGAGSSGDVWLSSNNARDTVTFSGFAPGTNAAGAYFFGSDIAGQYLQRGLVLVTATDSSGTVQKFKLRATEDTFFGFVSDSSLSSLSVRVLSGQRNPVWPTIDDLTLAAAVPEPGTYAMLLAGLGAIGFMARRRKI